MDAPHNRARAFGLTIASDVALPHLADAPAGTAVDLEVRKAKALRERGAPLVDQSRGSVYQDGVRLLADPAAHFDMIAGDRIDYSPRMGWTGIMPPRFYSTALALTLAWRRTVALHASAVAIGGGALLLCGASGAGKSTLTAALIAHGAGFIGDDLTAIDDDGEGHTTVHRGRITMRLHRDTAAWVPAHGRAPDRRDARGKYLIEPLRDDAAWHWPLRGILLIGERSASAGDRPDLLRAHLFRPRWQSMLPCYATVCDKLAMIARNVPILAVPAAAIDDREAFVRVGAALFDKASLLVR